MTPDHPPAFSAIKEEIPGLLFVDHIAIALPQGALEDHVAAYKLLGLEEIHRETIAGGDRVNEVLLRIGSGPNLIQLLEPTSSDSPIQKSIERTGGKGGLHHSGVRVRNIHIAFSQLQERGFPIIDKAPRPGSRGTTVFFLHPKGKPGQPLNVLIEVVQEESSDG